jgi:hypothetical protein
MYNKTVSARRHKAKNDMRKRMLTAIVATSMVWLPFGVAAQENVESNAEQKAEPTSGKTIQLDLNGVSCAVEVGEVINDKDGKPSVTIYSTAISGSISMSVSGMSPIVACAVLDDGKIIDPIFVAGGKGESGYSLQEAKVLPKQSSTASGGTWKAADDGSKGYLTYSFPVSQPVRKIIIGTYANYAKSDYDAFVSVDLQDSSSDEESKDSVDRQENPSNEESKKTGFIVDENDAQVNSSSWKGQNFTVVTNGFKITLKPPFPHQLTGIDDSYVQTAIGFMYIRNTAEFANGMKKSAVRLRSGNFLSCPERQDVSPFGSHLGGSTMNRTGTDNTANVKRGMAWLYKAAIQDNIDAILLLAAYYTVNGNVRNLGEAERWFRRAVELGNSNAQRDLDSMLSGKHDEVIIKMNNNYDVEIE